MHNRLFVPGMSEDGEKGRLGNLENRGEYEKTRKHEKTWERKQENTWKHGEQTDGMT
jgi:hypothetical protein